MFGMMVDIGPKFYGVPSPTPYMTLRLRSGHRLRIFMLKFYIKVFRIFMLKFYVKIFRTSLFPNPLMDLVHV